VNAKTTTHKFRSIVVAALLFALTIVVLPPSPFVPSVVQAAETQPPVSPLDTDPLSVTLESSAQDFIAGSSVTLTATSTVPVEQIGATIEIVNTGDDSVVKSCASGTACAVSVSFYTGDPREYVARIGDVESAPVTVARAAWSVSLKVDREVFSAGESFGLSAEANQLTQYTDGSYSLFIVDVTSGEVLKECLSLGSGPTYHQGCLVGDVYYTGDPHQYQAFIASRPGGYQSDVQASSGMVVGPVRAAWSVSLKVDREVFSAGESFGLSAEANQLTQYTDGSYSLFIVDVTSGEVLKECLSLGSGPTYHQGCLVGDVYYTGDPHQYQAFIASRPGGYQSDVQAASAGVMGPVRAPWSASLSIDKTVFAAGQYFTLKATADQNVGYTGGNYSIFIVDIGSGQVVKECTSGTTCSLTTNFYTGDPRSYQAFVASRPEGYTVDRQVSTNSVSVARAAWQVSLETVSQASPDANHMVKTTFKATTNQNIGYTDKNYRTYLYDLTTKTYLTICTSGWP